MITSPSSITQSVPQATVILVNLPTLHLPDKLFRRAPPMPSVSGGLGGCLRCGTCTSAAASVLTGRRCGWAVSSTRSTRARKPFASATYSPCTRPTGADVGGAARTAWRTISTRATSSTTGHSDRLTGGRGPGQMPPEFRAAECDMPCTTAESYHNTFRFHLDASRGTRQHQMNRTL